MNALASSLYVSRQWLNGTEIKTDDQRIRASGLYPDWTEQPYTVGAICNADGQTWECYHALDPALSPGVTPDGPAWLTFFRPLHATAPETARPFVPVTGAHDMYHTGEYMIWTDGSLQRCVRDTSFGPDSDQDAWEVVE